MAATVIPMFSHFPHISNLFSQWGRSISHFMKLYLFVTKLHNHGDTFEDFADLSDFMLLGFQMDSMFPRHHIYISCYTNMHVEYTHQREQKEM